MSLIKFFMFVALSFSTESATTNLQVLSSVNCDMILYKISQENSFHTRFLKLKDLQREAFYDWKETRFFAGLKKRRYLRVLEAMEDLLLLHYFSRLGNSRIRSIEIAGEWPSDTISKPEDYTYLIPGFMPMTYEELSLLDGVWFESTEDVLSFRMLVSPVDYCVRPQVMLHNQNKSFLAE